MKKAISALLATGMVLVSAPALAQPGTGDIYEGTLRVQKGIPILYCDFKAEFKSGMKVDITVTGGTPGCTSFTINSNSHDWVWTSPDLVTIKNVDVTTTLTPGVCTGDVNAIWSSGLLEVNDTLDGGGSGDCSLEGDLFL